MKEEDKQRYKDFETQVEHNQKYQTIGGIRPVIQNYDKFLCTLNQIKRKKIGLKDIKGKTGNLLTNENDIAKRWKNTPEEKLK